MVLGSTQPLTEVSTGGNVPEGTEGGRHVRLEPHRHL
jgi:hypothetical protein